MELSATIKNTYQQHSAVVQTDGDAKSIPITTKASGYGSSINGGELLLLALATCYCNDIYREASKRNINVTAIDVICTGEFGAAGEPGKNFQYQVEVIADAPEEEIDELIRHTDTVAEIQNTLRQGINVRLVH